MKDREKRWNMKISAVPFLIFFLCPLPFPKQSLFLLGPNLVPKNIINEQRNAVFML